MEAKYKNTYFTFNLHLIILKIKLLYTDLQTGSFK